MRAHPKQKKCSLFIFVCGFLFGLGLGLECFEEGRARKVLFELYRLNQGRNPFLQGLLGLLDRDPRGQRKVR